MTQPKSFLELLDLNIEQNPVIAVVGGGGKTSLIYRLTQEFLRMDKKVIISTTTHMAYEPKRPFIRGGNPAAVQERIEESGYVIAAELDESIGKFASLPMERLRELTSLCDVMLIEADGAKQMPLKVPEAWEPVIPPFADIVISVVGLDSLGKPIRETAFRTERTAELLKKNLDAPVTEGDIVKIVSSICGLFKDVEDRIYRVYLNKADVLSDAAPAQKIVEKLGEAGTVAAYGSLWDAP